MDQAELDVDPKASGIVLAKAQRGEEVQSSVPRLEVHGLGRHRCVFSSYLMMPLYCCFESMRPPKRSNVSRSERKDETRLSQPAGSAGREQNNRVGNRKKIELSQGES